MVPLIILALIFFATLFLKLPSLDIEGAFFCPMALLSWFRSFLDPPSTTCALQGLDEPETNVTELLSILPGDVETYHLTLQTGEVLTVTIESDTHIGLILLDEATWLATSAAERRFAPCRYCVPSTTDTVIEFSPPERGDFLLLLWNEGEETANAGLELCTHKAPPQTRKLAQPELGRAGKRLQA